MLAGGYPGFERAEITVVDKLTYAGNVGSIPIGHPRLYSVEGDICDRILLRELLPGQDYVVHFAAESHVDRSIHGGTEFVLSNVLGTQSLLEECLLAGVGPIVCVSTDEVYGSIADGSSSEANPLVPSSPYSASKAGGDLMAYAYYRTYGLDVRITRCSNNYGPYQHVEKLIPMSITNLLVGETVPLYGDGNNVREWVHVDDHCRAVQLVVTGGLPGEVYNIGGGAALSNRELVYRLMELCHVDHGGIRYVPDRPGHDRRYALDDSKIRTELGFSPAVPLEQGLQEVVSWYRDHPEWWKPLVK